jgi:hypothetical protein
MTFGKTRFVSTNNMVLKTLFSVLLWGATLNQFFNSLILDCSSVCGMVVYRVEKWNVLELNVTSKSIQFFCNIHIWLTALLEKPVSWYFLRPVLTIVKIEIVILKGGLVEHLAAPAISRCLYGRLCNFVTNTVREDYNLHLSWKDQKMTRLSSYYQWYPLLIA